MRIALHRGLSAAIVVASFGTALIGRGANLSAQQSTQTDSSLDQAKQLTHEALEAEANGQGEKRLALLQHARELAPDYVPARWQAGDVLFDGNWTHFDAPSLDLQHSAKWEEYLQKREQAGNTFDAQMEFARWCEKAGLKAQARTHWLTALKLRPGSAEARKKLGLVSYRGALVPASQVQESEANLKRQQEDYETWKERLVKLRAQLDNKGTAAEGLRSIREINDPAAIPALETIFGRSKPEAGKVVVDCLSKLPDNAATTSLARFALFSPNAEVREAAAKALKPRSMYAYVPQLLSGLNTPTAVQFNRFQLPNGSLGYQLSLVKDSPWGDQVHTSSGLMDTTIYPSFIANQMAWINATAPPPGGRRLIPGSVTVNVDSQKSTAAIARAAGGAEKLANQTSAKNDDIAASNEPILSVLRTATMQDLGSDPVAWWNWWYDYNEYDRPVKQPTQYSDDSTNVPFYTATITPPTIFNPPNHSCFTAGTPVWTMGGLVQIEKIKPGDAVLAQNPDTGELAYKPVLSTTVGPPLPIVNVRIGETVFRSTRGHPFWVDGAGWKMAKELKADDWVHSVRGPVMVESVESEKEPAVCYNLVVGDFETYFVGKNLVLVHDINFRQPTEAIVPGLVQR